MTWFSSLVDVLGHGQRACLITIAKAKGSAPREPGTAMVVTPVDLIGSIGGGRLEFQAMAMARKGFDEAVLPVPHLEPVLLGAQRGQCCGGKVWLAFEWFEPADDGSLATLKDATSVATIFDGSYRLPEAAAPMDRHCVLFDQGDTKRLVRCLLPDRASVVLFGAGHVGRALVNALAPLPFAVTWVDSRPEIYPELLPENVEPRPALEPQDEVARSAPDTFFLVMTHEHDLDERICARVLERSDFAYLGLIGSKTKARRFRMRLEGRGALGVDRLHSPIGLDGIVSKDPAVIAASVAADLLKRLENLQTERTLARGRATS